MAVTVKLFRSFNLGFDLDLIRPLYPSQPMGESVRTNWYGSRSGKSYTVSNWNHIGDSVIVPASMEELAMYSVMVINVGGTESVSMYVCRITGLSVNESRRTVVSYDVDWAETYNIYPSAGRCLRCPAGHRLAVGSPLSPRYWMAYEPKGMFTTRIALALSKFRGNSGTFFLIVDGEWEEVSEVEPYHRYCDPVKELTTHSIYGGNTGDFQYGDIVGAWALPKTFELSHADMGVGWTIVNPSSVPHVSTVAYSENAAATVITKSHNLPTYRNELQQTKQFGTDLANGLLAALTDERGNLLFTFPDLRKLGTTFTTTFNMSMTTCEIDISFGSERADTVPYLRDNADIPAHLSDMFLTYSCRPLDVVTSTWAEYASRQRQADIDNRSIQNERALSNIASNALTGAMTGAVVGTVVPGPGNIIGAVAGGIGGVVAGAIGYGIDTHAGSREQGVLDRTAKLAQDTLSLTGAVSARLQTAQGYAIYFVELEADPSTMIHVEQRNAHEGVQADGWVSNAYSVMSSAEGDENPWAFDIEVLASMPADRRRAIQETFRNGARWKRIGWPATES